MDILLIPTESWVWLPSIMHLTLQAKIVSTIHILPPELNSIVALSLLFTPTFTWINPLTERTIIPVCRWHPRRKIELHFYLRSGIFLHYFHTYNLSKTCSTITYIDDHVDPIVNLLICRLQFNKYIMQSLERSACARFHPGECPILTCHPPRLESSLHSW